MADLLVSCCSGDPGLFLVNTEKGTAERLQDGVYFAGIAITGSRIFVGERNGLLELDRSLTEVRRIELDEAHLHGLFARDGLLYLCTTDQNSVTVLDAAFLEPVGEILVPGTRPERGDQNHLSSVWVGDDVLFLSVHRWDGCAPDRPGAILALERKTERVLEGRCVTNLMHPHSVVAYGGDLYYCVSADQALHRNGEPIARFGGYPRGLAIDAHHYYVGQSRFRYAPEIPAPCGVVVIGRRDGEMKFIPLPAEEIFEVVILETRGGGLNMGSLSGVTAAVLAGGLGTRLRPVVADRPKALAVVGGRPFLSYVLEQLAGAGVRRAVLCTGYLGEQVQSEFGDTFHGLSLVYSRETSPLGTAGALRLALPLFKSDTVLVMNGDSYCQTDLGSFWSWYRGRAAAGALVLTRVSNTSPYGRVVCRGGRVVSFEEKQAGGGPGWVNAGIYLLARRVMAAIPAGRAVSLEKEVLPSLVERGLYGYRSRGRFVDIGTPETFVAAEHLLSIRSTRLLKLLE